MMTPFRHSTSTCNFSLMHLFGVAIIFDTILVATSFVPSLFTVHSRCDCRQRQRQHERYQAKRSRHNDDILWVEKGLKKDRGFYPILGSDESGRGCVAGPVVAATCAVLCNDWNDYTPISNVRDSKELSPQQREVIYEEVVTNPSLYVWSVAQRPNTVIDETNILLATMECFKDSIELVVKKLPDHQTAYSIVDGKKGPKLSVNIPSRPWVQGDKEVYSVALASIIAKVTRDQMSKEWHSQFPEYGFDIHKGYATTEHVEAIHKYGPCPIHRLSFKTLKGR